MTLRTRLLLGILGLLAAVSIIVGTVSVATLDSSLRARLDSQLISATSRTQGVIDGPGGGPGGGRPEPTDFLKIAGLPPSTIGGYLRGGVLNVRVLGDDLETTQLTTAQQQVLLGLSTDSEPQTLDLGGDLGEYRFRIAEGDGRGGQLVIGLPLNDVRATVLQLILVILLVTVLGLLAAFFAGRAIVRVALRPLERVAATATAVSELPLERGEVALAPRVPDEDADPSTEVGQVGAAFNRMLGHVASALTAREASERKVRTFVADASHELRTPLASIRGYAELTRRGGHDLPADVAHALARVESESIRMTGLVDDLLLLARLDDGRSLESHPVDLTALLADAVSDAHAAGQEHEWILELPDQPITVEGDAVRLHQVVANLLTNARVHTPAGTRVVASLESSGGRAIIRVRDDGPGIDEKVRETVFERFSRGDGSRSRAAGSTGLGLAIAAAIVEAHGGTVSVDSEPGGTTFVVELPIGPSIT
ncbi:HAMP domain-containing histidine kinase [Glaciihabitans arcticus]|uniref:histidine kinase n=1 Tax=Glaciihabitans arcticus TaxID=2668039 RepID=A0A4Q9GMF9_9MICO|nr:HAMP domain-containing sensor histidine kinase [Glaciihabitans arcticus]TBN55492.1 HAMP domain-containing histidine kinase [Glaciihabitans arcticus]